MRLRPWLFCSLVWLAATVGCARHRSATPEPAAAHSSPPAIRTYQLKAAEYWRLNAPKGERFDASALLRLPDASLITVSDRGPTLYRIRFGDTPHEAALEPIPGWFTSAQLEPFRAQKKWRYDSEGLGLDEQGRLYLAEEGNRWIMRLDPAARQVERLAIDWTPVSKYFSRKDGNASFEGVAVGGNRLYVANERQVGRIIELDLATLKIVDDYRPRPLGSKSMDISYSDLSWHGGQLYALLRDDQLVLQIDPATHEVKAQFDYASLETEPEFAYLGLGRVGLMEGLSVEDDAIWLVVDNNGCPRLRNPTDTRPTLFKCRRPDR